MSRKPCYVYIICFADGEDVKGPCKIGVTTSLPSRLKSLQTGSHAKQVLLGSVIMGDKKMASGFEAILHKLLGKYRLHGEWFDVSPPIAAGFLAQMARMAFEGMGFSGSKLGEVCDQSGATLLQLYFARSPEAQRATGIDGANLQ